MGFWFLVQGRGTYKLDIRSHMGYLHEGTLAFKTGFALIIGT